jgi:hypothetical protein
VRPCVDAEEESWVANGTFESAVGAGEAPGAEEWVATPLALVRYAAAKVAIDVPAMPTKGEALRVTGGVAYVWVSDDARAKLVSGDGGALAPSTLDEGWARMGEGQSAEIVASAAPGAGHRGETPEAAARRAMTKCGMLADAAREGAAAILRGSADGGTIASQVSTRRLAHAACAVASVRVGSLPESDAKASLLATLKAKDAAYAGLPLGG